MAQKQIYVFADWQYLTKPTLMGILNVEHIRGSEVFSFEYDNEWLKNQSTQLLDPELGWFKGNQYLNTEKNNFGVFLDSSPDRWGQVLMKRREAIVARKEKRQPKQLFSSDYLLGVYDGHRMGALRFKEDLKGDFLNNNKELATPPWASLRDLEYASLQIEKDDVIDNPEYLKWLNMLIAPGTSLGGARPKAGILDNDNKLWIAKFPSANDEYDTGLWEMLAYKLAVNSGIIMSESKTIRLTGKHHTFLTKRFDRTELMERIHFASAMTLLGKSDGDNYKEGVSYLDIVGFIIQYGDSEHINSDLEQLWRRIVFSICVKNIDDHLRNHGFILGENGWRLSPAYDINPMAYGTGLSLNISENDNSLDLQLALDVAEYFRINNKEANNIIDIVQKVVSKWQDVANELAIPRIQQELMQSAFLY